MSRIGKMPLEIPNGVEFKVSAENVVTVKGPKGTLEKAFDSRIKIETNDNIVTVTRPNDVKDVRALHGLTRALLNNMVVGVTNGFEKVLEINGVGYRAQKQGNKVILNLGYSHQVEVAEEDGITIDVPDPNKLIIKGIDKEKVGQFAANVREKRPPEPYKGKGIKYADEVIKRKEGKTGGK